MVISRRGFLGIGVTGAFTCALASGAVPEASAVMKFLDSDTKAFPYRTGKEHWWGFIDETGNLLIPAQDSEINGSTR